MLDLLGKDPENLDPSEFALPQALQLSLEQGFKEVGGCVVPASFEGSELWTVDSPRGSNQNDETGFECSINHVHLDAFISSGVAMGDLARLGVEYAFSLKKALALSQMAGKFKIIISLCGPDSEPAIGATCTVRFHRIREGQVWLDNELEAYTLEAIAVGEFGEAVY